MDSTRRVIALSTVCVLVAAIAPSAPMAGRLDRRAWTETAIPQAMLATKGKGIGVSALSSDGRLAVVADMRAVYVFRAPSKGSWDSSPRPAARLRLPSSAMANLTAVTTSSDGTTVLVAAGAVGRNRAAVYVFHVPSPRAWRSLIAPIAKLTNAAEPAGFGSGVALSSDGTTALVGDLGGADVFHVAAADSWRNSTPPTARLVVDALGAEAGGLSIAVALSADGTTALVGATSLDTFVGAAYVFRAPNAEAWISSATPDAVLTDGAIGLFGDGFGGSVALSPDGMTALVGAPNVAFGPAGAAYFFHARSPEDWTSTTNPDAVAGRHGGRGYGEVPGWSVALSGESTALIGEPSVLRTLGAADVLHVAASGQVSQAKLTNAASPPGDLFAVSVALSSDGTTALVSSVRATFIYTQSRSQGSQCYVPYVKGKTLQAAKRGIKSTHCSVGKVTRVKASRSRSTHVISQTPKPGKRLAKGSMVTLRVIGGRP